MPVATQAGVFGIGALPSSGPGPSSGSRSRGGMPSSVQSVSLACPSWIRRAGMVERVCSRTVLACSTSSLVVVPTRNFSSARARIPSWIRTLSRAILMRCWATRYCT